MASEVAGIGADQEIDALSNKGIDQESQWNGAKIVYLHQPTFLFLNFENIEVTDHSANTKLKLRVSGVPDAELLERIKQILEMRGLGDAKVELVSDNGVKV